MKRNLHKTRLAKPAKRRSNNANKLSNEAMVDLDADKGFVIAPVREAFDLSANVRVLPIDDLSAVWRALG